MLTLPSDSDTAGRILHQLLLADARRVASAWVEGEPHPAELTDPGPPPPEVPMTCPMPAVVVADGMPTSEGRHRAGSVVRIRPLTLAACVLSGASVVLSQISEQAATLIA